MDLKYCPSFKGDEGSTIVGILEKNGLYISRKEAMAVRDKNGGKPDCLFKIIIIRPKWVKKGSKKVTT